MGKYIGKYHYASIMKYKLSRSSSNKFLCCRQSDEVVDVTLNIVFRSLRILRKTWISLIHD